MNELPDKHLVARSFGHAAQHYDDVAVLQRQTADELLDRLDLVTVQPKVIVDLGVGTGRNLPLLAKRYPEADYFAVDIAPEMLRQAKQHYRRSIGLSRWWPTTTLPRYVAGDAEKLPLADNTVDFIFANLTLQWCDPRISFAEIQRVLKPDGLLMFSTLGPNTLRELRQAWASVDDYQHVNMFYDMHDVGEAMMSARLAQPVLDTEHYTLTYDTSMTLMRDLKSLGASNVNHGRRRGLTGKSALLQMTEVYEQFRQNDLLPATYEVIFGHAWGSQNQPTQHADSDGSIRIPISQIKQWKSA